MAKTGTLFGKPRGEVVKRPGAFTAKAKAAGQSTAGYAKQVLKEGSSASTRTKRQAALAQTFQKLRAGKAKFLLPLLLAAAPLEAATKSCPSGSLGTFSANGRAADVVVARAATGLVFQAVRTAGTADAIIEISCDGTNWAPITNGTLSVSASTLSAVTSVLAPTCTYTVRIANCASCTLSVTYACSGA